MKRYIIGLVLLIAVSFSVKAQQEPYNTMFAFNKLPVNPAYTGGKDVLSVRAVYRHQWVNLPGNPQTLNFNIHSPLKIDRVALGGSIINDRLGATNMTHLNVSFAYRLPFRNDTKLSFGISAGMMIFNSKIIQLDVVDIGDPLLTENLKGVRPNIGLGIYYYGTKFYAGIAIPNAVPVSLFDKKRHDGISGSARLQQLTSLLFMGGYTFEMGKDKKFWLQPQILLKYMPKTKTYNIPLEIDANLTFTMFKMIGLGVTYRTGIADPFQNRESVDIMIIGYLPKNITIGYAYDQTVSKIKSFNKGPHEIMIGYDVGLKQKGIRTPRYF
jgi:type IX secretion system PorP/SprF family membrane protein